MPPQREVVLGGYGLIGSACLTALADAGFAATGIGRSALAAKRAEPRADWHSQDLTQLSAPEWTEILQGASVVVNAAGALQEGLRDDLTAIHVTALSRLIVAARSRKVRIIQISAAGARPTASTEFFRSKAAGNEILRQSSADWVILRPTLVLAPESLAVPPCCARPLHCHGFCRRSCRAH